MGPEDDLYTEVKKIPWFRDLSEKHMKNVGEIARLRRVKGGEIIFREGDKEDNLYIVLEGRISLDMYVPARGKVRFYSAEPWEVIGWSSVTPNVHQRTAGAAAVQDSLLLAVDAEKLRQLCDQDHDLGYLVMRRLANIVASRLLVTRLQLIDMFGEPSEKKNA